MMPLLLPAALVAAPTPEAPVGNLFSAILLGETPLGAWWTSLRPQAAKAFPGLKFKQVADLHITVVYIGGWSDAALPRLRAASLVSPDSDVHLQGTPARLGRDGRVLALDLHGIPEAWAREVIAARQSLATEGLRRADAYDATFRAHVTLAERTPTTGPNDLDRFEAWLKTQPPPPALRLPQGTRPRLMLSGPREAGQPEYRELK